MSNIVRDSDVVELSEPPYFSFGEKVKAKRVIRNDGTYAGKEIGEILAKKGEVGYVVSIGTFLQQFYIYGVEFVESGNRVGMKRKELEPVIPRDDEADLPLPGSIGVMIEPRLPKYQWGQRVKALIDLHNDGSFPDAPAEALLVGVGATGEIVQVGTHTESNTPIYLVEFGERLVVGCLEEEIVPL